MVFPLWDFENNIDTGMKIRKIVKNGILVTCVLFMLLILSGIIVVLVLLCTTPKLSYGNDETTDPWQACYYVFTIIGSIGTLSAVIVALYKEELMRWINRPDLDFDFIGNKLTVNNESMVGQAPDSYDCSINISNQGTTTALGCRMFVQSIKYNKNRNKDRLKPLTTVQNKKQLIWTSGSVDIPVDIPSEILLFQILNPNQIGTPQGGNTNFSPKIVFNGYQLGNDKSGKGLWEIEYYITMRSGNTSKFILTIDWDGTWSDNEEDMLDKVIIDLKKL